MNAPHLAPKSPEMLDPYHIGDASDDSDDPPGEFHRDEPDEFLTKVQRNKSSVSATSRRLPPSTPGPVEGETGSASVPGPRRYEQVLVGFPLFLHESTGSGDVRRGFGSLRKALASPPAQPA